MGPRIAGRDPADAWIDDLQRTGQRPSSKGKSWTGPHPGVSDPARRGRATAGCAIAWSWSRTARCSSPSTIPARIDRRLQLANVVYGLSAAQLRLAREIVGGLALPAAAEKLGISPNTARTHLNRIFEKTGVSNQAALVRCLLTVGA